MVVRGKITCCKNLSGETGCLWAEFHVFLPNLHAHIMKKRDKILQEAKARLVAAFGDRIKDVILFGSRAWGKPHRWSDWDFLVVVRGEYDWCTVRDIRYILADVDLDFDIFTQTLVVSDDELQHTFRGYEPIFVKALSNGIYA
jgi:predicted nucleotidyltransferase